MKSKIFLMIAAVAAASFVHAQLPNMSTGINIMPSSTQLSKIKHIPVTPNTNGGVTNEPASSSSPIIIDYTNNLVPVEAADENLVIFAQQIQVPGAGQNKVYDYGNLVFEPENLFTNILLAPPEPSLSIDRTAYQTPGNAIDFNGLLVSTVSLVYATNNQGLYITRVHFTAARASLESITGVETDSLIIPEQNVIIPNGSLIQKYPTTFGSQWIQDPGKTGPNIFISLASEGLDHAPVKLYHEHHFVHKIVGWGKIRIPAADGPSSYFRCLLDKVSGLDILSLYVNGNPASEAVSNIFFGNPNYKQKSNIYQYNFLKRGFWDVGAEAALIMDPGFSKVLYAIFDESYLDIDCADGEGVNMCLDEQTSCVLYENNSANIAMLNLGATLGACNQYQPLMDVPGNTVQSTITDEVNPITSTMQLKIYPNPISIFTNISFSLPQSQKVSIQIFDMMGKLVKTLVNEQMPAGAHQIVWNVLDEKGKPVNSGIYLLSLCSGNYIETKMMSLVN